ncbi:FAD-dependent oxidoreductase [Mycolicibacterium rufum]|uniref:FAD-dependent oxidoreductase n=1 Tax=Mycolicibacterium rufum TaxID=318424 RepID=A0A9X2Y4P2_9MYCO|nr:FAD-dependent oxidoreductase [Mycolicibacterium rufum]KGI69642.1 pyridine nucleotide-disulfide oxidoreductase [Mycolicibacterium rufum]MCV7073877.1 FAD-dependent oxidoreductase [Mycolicibacterium rufum]ULP35879.1 FAD-dependent oxidoreductase [Mycolicibacterium rufum]
MTARQFRVLVIGGGYAGVMAANRLTSRDDLTVTLVNPRPHFVERIRLHQLVAGSDDAAVDYRDVLNDRVHLLVDSVERIDAAARRIVTSSGATLDYDYLVYAAGSTGAVPASVPGAAEFGYSLSEWEPATRLTARLNDLALPAPVVVVGGGLTGIETAAELAEAGRTVTLVSTVVGPSLSRPGRRSVTSRLRRLGVSLLDGEGATVTAVGPDHVALADGRLIASAVTVWAAGFGVPGLAAASGLTTDGTGRVVTDETYTSVDDDRIVAAGDSAAPSRRPYRMSCQASLPMGVLAADTVLARIAGEAPVTISVPMTAQCISLGRRAGTLQVQRADDTPIALYVGGRAGALIKEQVCRWTVKWMAGEAAEPGSYRSRKGPVRGAVPADEAIGVR